MKSLLKNILWSIIWIVMIWTVLWGSELRGMSFIFPLSALVISGIAMSILFTMQYNKGNDKVASRIVQWGHGVLILGVIIFLATSISKLYSEPEDNFPLEVRCNMNGFWRWECTFTNLKRFAKSECGRIVVKNYYDRTTIQSAQFCSWKIPSKDTKVVPFTVIWMDELCSQNGKSWQDVCDFEFKPSEK